MKVDTLGGVELLKAIQTEILKDPSKGGIISGAGGVRKIRVAKPKSGKSGGYRVFLFGFTRIRPNIFDDFT